MTPGPCAKKRFESARWRKGVESEQFPEEQVNDIGDLDREIEEELGENENSEGEEEGDNGGDLWTPRKEDKLIDYFQRCTFLYDKSLDDYRLRNKKICAYNVFAKKRRDM